MALAHQLEVVLDAAGQRQALAQVGVLRQREQDVRFGTFGVKAVVGDSCVLFQVDGGVFRHGHFQLVVGLVQPHGVGFGAVGGAVLVGVAVDADEQIGALAVADGCAFIKLDKAVVIARQGDGQLRRFLFEQGLNLLRNAQGHIFLQGQPTARTAVVPPMARIQHHVLYLHGAWRPMPRGLGETYKGQNNPPV